MLVTVNFFADSITTDPEEQTLLAEMIYYVNITILQGDLPVHSGSIQSSGIYSEKIAESIDMKNTSGAFWENELLYETNPYWAPKIRRRKLPYRCDPGTKAPGDWAMLGWNSVEDYVVEQRDLNFLTLMGGQICREDF